jgi:hypothetical protein
VKVERLAIADLLLIKPTLFGDERGFFSEVWSRRALAVQCCAYPRQQALTVERLARCNNDVGATCILQGTLIIYILRGATRCCAACSAAHALACPASKKEKCPIPERKKVC